MKILITGSSGLIGGEAVQYFDSVGHTIIGVDNNMRKEFFGHAGDTEWNLHRIAHMCKNFTHSCTDIRDYHALKKYVFDVHGPFDAVIHCAAQPSHDKAKDFPLTDFEVNAVGTLNLLELTRHYCKNAPFVFMSTNKVYGDGPNSIPLIENETRYEFANLEDYNGIKETFSIDQCTHSVFGASKVAADVMVQEYGRYFGMNTCVFRGGCLTGPAHSGVELHGFLSYLVKCVMHEIPYKIYGYKGKQVRDNIHSYDVVKAIEYVIKNPNPGAVYNMGGGRENSISMLEAISIAEEISGKKLNWQYVDENRIGDHICYISDLTKFKNDYPEWKITKDIRRTITEIIGATYCGATTERYLPGDGGDSYFESYSAPIENLCRGRVLDIGCGHGYLTTRIANSTNVISVLGTDIFDKYRESNSKTSYITISTEDLISKEFDKFDTIVSTEHIEHLDEEIQLNLIKWIIDHLDEKGIFLGSMPTQDDPNNPNPYHKKTYSSDQWFNILKNNFNFVEITNTGENGYWWRAQK